MRPWTVVVLSDYGRDRIAYQSYDQLFSPNLPARQLALHNRACPPNAGDVCVV